VIGAVVDRLGDAAGDRLGGEQAAPDREQRRGGDDARCAGGEQPGAAEVAGDAGAGGGGGGEPAGKLGDHLGLLMARRAYQVSVCFTMAGESAQTSGSPRPAGGGVPG
jgi:hypothetical protein